MESEVKSLTIKLNVCKFIVSVIRIPHLQRSVVKNYLRRAALFMYVSSRKHKICELVTPHRFCKIRTLQMKPSVQYCITTNFGEELNLMNW